MTHRGRAAAAVIVVITLGGCAGTVAPAYHGPRSDHFDGKRFFNYERTPAAIPALCHQSMSSEPATPFLVRNAVLPSPVTIRG